MIAKLKTLVLPVTILIALLLLIAWWISSVTGSGLTSPTSTTTGSNVGSNIPTWLILLTAGIVVTILALYLLKQKHGGIAVTLMIILGLALWLGPQNTMSIGEQIGRRVDTALRTNAADGFVEDVAPNISNGAVRIDYRTPGAKGCLTFMATNPAEESYLRWSDTPGGPPVATHTNGVVYIWSILPNGKPIGFKYRVRRC